MNKGIIIIIAIILIGGGIFLIIRSKGEEETSENDKTTTTVDKKEQDTDAESEGYKDISPEEAYEMVTDNPNFVIVDVSPNYDEGHLPGAVNYYVGDGSLDRAIPTLDKSKSYLIYCHVDSASISGANIFVSAGFANVYRLEGNYQAWVDAGLPIEK